MGKTNLTKSSPQKRALEEYYSTPGPAKWTRDSIESFARQVGLTRQRVYKWMWDKRNHRRLKHKTNNPPKQGHSMPYSSDHQMHLKVVGPSRMFNYEVKVPSHLEGLQAIRVEEKVSVKAVRMLQREGWQLVRERKVVWDRQYYWNSSSSERPREAAVKMEEDVPQRYIHNFTMIVEEPEGEYLKQ